jgi:hypothetical protein
MKTYGVLLEDIDFAKIGKTKAIGACVVPVFHKLLLGVVIMYFLSEPILAILAFTLCSLLILAWIYHESPYTDYHYKRRLLLNEYVLLIITYHLYCFTEWQDIDNQILAGNSVIYFVIF